MHVEFKIDGCGVSYFPCGSRVVHGNEEFHSAVTAAVTASHSSAAPDAAKERNGAWTWNVAGCCDFRDRTGVQARRSTTNATRHSLNLGTFGNIRYFILDFLFSMACS